MSYGTTIERIAQVAVKNHNNGALNGRAQYRFTTTLDEVLQDRVVALAARAMVAITKRCCRNWVCSKSSSVVSPRDSTTRHPGRTRSPVV